MFSKTPRQTIFDTVSSTPGPGSYNPKDTRSSNAATNIFHKQGERFGRENSNLSTCSTSTAGSASSFRRPTATVAPSRTNKLQEKLRTFEQQVRERDEIIARLRMDRSSYISRYQTLFESYRHLRRVSAQSIPSHKLPKDISQDIMRFLQDEKQQVKDENRPSMTEGEIKDSMTTFIVEMEEEQDPRIALLESEKASLEVSLAEHKKYVLDLEQERERLNEDIQRLSHDLGHMKGSIRAAEVKEAELRTQLERANVLVDSMNSNSTHKDNKLFATLAELGEVKAQLVALEGSLAQQTSQNEENRAKYEDTTGKLKAQIDQKENSLKELRQNMNELSANAQQTIAQLRLSQEERERLAGELTKTADTLNKHVQENSVLEQKLTATLNELEDLRAKCKKRKAELGELDEQLRIARTNQNQAESRLASTEQELARVRDELQAQFRHGDECRNDFERQLRQSQENFERQLDEATKTHDAIIAQKAEVEAELRIAANNMRTLEKQVQERDQLLEKGQKEIAMLRDGAQKQRNTVDSLQEQLSEKSDSVTKLENQLRLMQIDEEEAQQDADHKEAQCNQLQKLAEQQLCEIRNLEEELATLKEANLELENSLQKVLDEVEHAGERQRTLEQESSQIKLLHLATTAELEQTKAALEKAHDENAKLGLIQTELATVEAEKVAILQQMAELEERTTNWSRVKNTLEERLREAEAANSKAQELHDIELRRKNEEIGVLEQRLQYTKEEHDEELVALKASMASMEKDQQELQSKTVQLQEKFDAEKREAIESLRRDNELLKSERDSLMSAHESVSLQLSKNRSELIELQQKQAEAEYLSQRYRQLESDSERLRESVSMLQEDLAATRQELLYVKQQLDEERRANEAHATFTLAIIRSHYEGPNDRALALTAENDKLRHHLESVTQLLNTLESGIESSEKQKSAYVSSLAETQEQIRRLVGHSNNKQRIQYVGKLQQENRELKEEQAKLRAKVDTASRRIAQLEQQLRKAREQETRLERGAAGGGGLDMSVATVHAPSHVSNASIFPRMF